jgi:NTP pyrophosphatase (non-canonical NTP hydrolase)
MTFDNNIENVISWADKRGLLKKENAHKQMLKVLEEVGETAAALIRNKDSDTIDGIGDSFVTLIILSKQLGYDPALCLQKAWDEIKDRTGTMIDGNFIKDDDEEILKRVQIKIH